MKKPYLVTDAAAPMTDVAGKRRRPGDRVELTNPEAEFELLRGVIEPAEIEVPEAPPALPASSPSASRRADRRRR